MLAEGLLQRFSAISPPLTKSRDPGQTSPGAHSVARVSQPVANSSLSPTEGLQWRGPVNGGRMAGDLGLRTTNGTATATHELIFSQFRSTT
jgi:hypothetical protein